MGHSDSTLIKTVLLKRAITYQKENLFLFLFFKIIKLIRYKWLFSCQWAFLNVAIYIYICYFFFLNKKHLASRAWEKKKKRVLETKPYQGSLNEQKSTEKQPAKFLNPVPVFPLFSKFSSLFSSPHPENSASDLQISEKCQ